MKVDDEVRIKVLDAMFNGGLEANFSKIAKISGLDVKTVRNSIFFLEKENVITSYMPLISARRLGFYHLHVDVTNYEFNNEGERKRVYEDIRKRMPNEYMVYTTNGPGLMNKLTMGIFRNGHDKYQCEKKLSDEVHLRKWMKDKISIPLMEKLKYEALSKTVVDILKKEKGIK